MKPELNVPADFAAFHSDVEVVEHEEIITLLMSVASTSKTGTSSLKTIQECAKLELLEDRASTKHPWALTPKGCELLADELVTIP